MLRSIRRQPEVALELRMDADRLAARQPSACLSEPRLTTSALAAMRTAAIMLRLIADDMDDAAIERAKISTPFPWPDKSKS